MEEVKAEESMTLNQIEEEDVGIQPIMMVRNAEVPKESKLDSLSQLIMS